LIRLNCAVCSGSSARKFYKGLVVCSECGHVFADYDLTDDELRELYSKNYFFGEEYNDYVADKNALQKNFMLRLKTLQRFLVPGEHKSLFEIGCAYGFFLDLARDYFESVSGIDISEDGICYARRNLGLDVLQGDFTQADLDDREFDVVCLWDTIEHLRCPHLYLEKLARHMHPGSLLTITTGDIKSLNASLKGESWRLIHPPTHLHYFSTETLTRLLNRYGFEVVYNRPCGFYRSLDQVAYNIFVLRGRSPGLYDLLQKMRIKEINFYLNLYDIRYFIARKL